jgi:hypothetical protein
VAISALWRRSRAVPVGMLSISVRHSLVSSTGILPVFTTCFGPRTAKAGLAGTTWPVISQSNTIRTVASCCFTPGRVAVLKRLYMGGNVGWPDGGQRQAAALAPGEEPAARPGIGPARVRVADVGAKEFGVAPAACSAASVISAGTTHSACELINIDLQESGKGALFLSVS